MRGAECRDQVRRCMSHDHGDQGADAILAGGDVQHLTEGSQAHGRGRVHRTVQGCFRRQHLPQAVAGLLTSRGHGPGRLPCRRRRRARPRRRRRRRRGYDGHHVARRNRLGRHQHGRVKQFAEAGRGDDARLLEQCLPGDQRRRRGCKVRGDGTLARSRPPGMDGQHGEFSAHPPRGPGEPARVAEGLQVENGQLSGAVRLPPQQHVSTRDIQLVAHRGGRGDPDAQPGKLLEQRGADPSGLDDQAGAAGVRVAHGGRGRQPDVRHRHAVGSRARQPHASPAGDLQQL